MWGRGGGFLSCPCVEKKTLVSSEILQVSVRERQLAERQYLKEYAQEWMESQTDENKRRQFSQQHPRFANLVKGLYTHKPFVTHTAIILWKGRTVCR